MSSLGYRRGCDHNSARPGEQRAVSTSVILPVVTAQTTVTPRMKMSCGMMIPKGFIPLLFYSCLAGTMPLLFNYVSYDYTDNMVRGGVIGASALITGLVVAANDCAVWFNMVLFFHIGLEVKVLDTLWAFAQTDSTSNQDEIMAWVGVVVIIAHLIPFLLIDNTIALALLAMAGVVVNAATLVYLDSTMLLFVGFSSVSLLGTTLCITGVCDASTSILSALRDAMKGRMWITCEEFKM